MSNTGWICPKCGAGVSPEEKTCPCPPQYFGPPAQPVFVPTPEPRELPYDNPWHDPWRRGWPVTFSVDSASQ